MQFVKIMITFHGNAVKLCVCVCVCNSSTTDQYSRLSAMSYPVGALTAKNRSSHTLSQQEEKKTPVKYNISTLRRVLPLFLRVAVETPASPATSLWRSMDQVPTSTFPRWWIFFIFFIFRHPTSSLSWLLYPSGSVATENSLSMLAVQNFLVVAMISRA